MKAVGKARLRCIKKALGDQPSAFLSFCCFAHGLGVLDGVFFIDLFF